MTQELTKKVDRAVRLIKSTVGDNTVEISYSGGKDSDVILELAKMAGVKYRAIYKNTTIDPPGTIAHCKANGVEIIAPKTRFFDLIAQKGFPTMRARFCCEVLKEYKVLDTAIHGIRREESAKRAKRYNSNDPVICRIYGSKKNHANIILPILDWTKKDVAEFILERGIRCHPLYYKNGVFDPSKRLGCIGCPMSPKKAIEEFKQYPKYVKLWIKAGQKYLDTHPNVGAHKNYKDAYELFVADYFYKTYEEFLMAITPDLFGETLDCKAFLEKTFNIKFE